ncbi:MAG: 30S ribosomal protein S24e [Candidatus Marsarchaeota archaeon]|jgi:small subunit ribosomal protein S24e|nr:30S ribosomal protein S24e [Candidatus Marsarchaeota archaeon]
MNIKIVSEFDNKLLDRKEIKFIIENTDSQTPRKLDVKAELCKKASLNPDNTIIMRINQEFGSQNLNCVAHYYNSKESIAKFEHDYILNKKNAKEKVESKEEAK